MLTSPFSRLGGIRRALHRGQLAFARGDLASAERAGRGVLDLLEGGVAASSKLSAPDRQALVTALDLVASVRREVSDFRSAADSYRQALGQLDAVPESADTSSLRVTLLVQLGDNLRLVGRFDAAEDTLRKAVRLTDSLQPADPIRRANALNALGILLKDTDRFTEAQTHYEQSLFLLREALGPEAVALAPLYHNLAGLEHAQGQYDKGEPFIRHALELRAPTEGLKTVGAAGDLGVLGAILLGQGRYAEAESALEESLRIWQAKYGPRHFEVAVARHNLAAVYEARGEKASAIKALAQVIDIKSETLGPTHPDVTALRRHMKRIDDARTASP
jgi:uncharacterized protein HemY